MTVSEVELTFSLIEGEAEEKFIEKAVADMKERRSKYNNNQKGRGGRRQQFTRKRTRNDERNHNSGKRAKLADD